MSKVWSLYPFSDQNGVKALPSWAAYTYMAYIKEHPTPRCLKDTLVRPQVAQAHYESREQRYPT